MTAPRAPRIEMQERWYNYVCEELPPRALEINREQGPDHMGKVLVGGASMGAGHAVNLFLRRPDLYNGTIALSGLYQVDMFFKGYMDDLVYRNSPCDYMRNFPDNHPYKELYAKADKFIMCCGQGQWKKNYCVPPCSCGIFWKARISIPLLTSGARMFPTTGIGGKNSGLFPGNDSW